MTKQIKLRFWMYFLYLYEYLWNAQKMENIKEILKLQINLVIVSREV